MMSHTCACGNEIVTQGWNNNVNTTLRCQECREHRQALLATINQAVEGKEVEILYISTDLRELLSINDFAVDVSYRRAEKMNGQLFQIVLA